KKVTAVVLVGLAVTPGAGGLLRQHTPAASEGGTPRAGGRGGPSRAETPARQGAQAQPQGEGDPIPPGGPLRVGRRRHRPTRASAKVVVVEQAGTVNLGAPYGRVRIRGQTFEEAEAIIRNHLGEFVKDPQVSVERDVSAPEDRYGALERRVQQLETAVRDLQAG